MELYFSGLTDVGNVRANNEDYRFCGKLGPAEYLFIVADGMGGHQMGEVASRKAVSLTVAKLSQLTHSSTDIPAQLRQIIQEVNEAVYNENIHSNRAGSMGTTLSILFVKDGLGYIAHVGDSRIYRFRPDTPTPSLTQLTEDHSLVGQMVKEGLISEEEARTHPHRNIINQSIGIKAQVQPQTPPPIPIQPGDKFLLCSDGLCGPVRDNEILAAFPGNSTAAVTRKLVQLAKKKGAPDNVTIIAVSTLPESAAALNDPLSDTVKIKIPRVVNPKRRRTLIFLLLVLLLLLAGLVYLLVTTTLSVPGKE